MNSDVVDKAIDQAYDVQMEKVGLVASENYLAFTKYTFPEFKLNWHHRLIDKYLEKFLNFEITRLMIFIQPQIGKSEMVSRRLPPFILGKDPDHQIIAATYGAQFTQTFKSDVNRIMETPKYKSLFPSTQIAKGQDGWKNNASMFEIIGRRGKYHAVGVGGSLTGKTANTLIIDDPVKNQQEADSEVIRLRNFNWFVTTARSRVRPDSHGNPGRILITQTRWHEGDLSGMLLDFMKKMPDADQWVVLSLPAEKYDDSNPEDPRQIGEMLWPEVFTPEDMKAVKATSSRAWSALYQQNPAPEGGSVINREWWKYYKSYAELPEFDELIQSWDLTYKDGKNNDYTVGQVWGRKGADKYLLDQVRAQMGFTQQLRAFEAMSAKWPRATRKLVEDAANGAALIDTLKSKITGIIAVKPNGTKLARAQAISPQAESGNLYLPSREIALWVDDYVNEWSFFPYGKNDDQVDSTSQAVNDLTTRTPLTGWAPVSFDKPSLWRK